MNTHLIKITVLLIMVPFFSTLLIEKTFSEKLYLIESNTSIEGTNNDDIIVVDDAAIATDIDSKNGNDQITGSSVNDNIYSGKGDDEVHADVLESDTGNDIIFGQDGDDRLLGVGGYDIIYGNEGNDYLKGGDEGGMLEGGEGNDILVGVAKDTILSGGPGTDVFICGAGLDIITDLNQGTEHDEIKEVKDKECDFISTKSRLSASQKD